MTDTDRLIVLLENALLEVMQDLDKDIGSHTAFVLSDEARALSRQLREMRGDLQ
jgi:hypothetical protein